MKTNHFLSLAVMLCISLFFSCTSDVKMPPPPTCPDGSEYNEFCFYSSSSIESSSSIWNAEPPSSSSIESSSSIWNAEPPSSSSIESSSSIWNAEPPSSPSIESSSSSANINGDFIDSRDGKVYRLVKIGTQIWMAENLNYEITGSMCGNCATYGRLYNWATAMDLPPSCNTSSCAISAKHQGICPPGWYVPSNADWDKLIRYVDGNTGTSSPYDSPTAGKDLKAASGWNGENGTNTSGFSALPGGGNYSNGGIEDIGYYGIWWSASESNSNNAFSRNMGYDYDNVYYLKDNKSYLFSIRCFQEIPQ